jgi:hypothetical protein
MYAIDGSGNVSQTSLAVPAIFGTQTNDNAPTGYIGEYITSTVPLVSAMGLINGIPADITSITLGAGDWDVFGRIAFTQTVTAFTQIVGWINNVSATIPATINGALFQLTYSSAQGTGQAYPTGVTRFSLSSPTQIYLSAQASFASGSASAYGYIGARRAR